MKTAIVYASTHHENTRKLIDAIKAADPDVVSIDTVKEKTADLKQFDRIGIASGIAFGKYYPQILQFLQENLPENKDVFFLHTAGDPRENQNTAAKEICTARHCNVLGTYFCKGYDTYGPFKLIGGIAKGHPDASELSGAVAFYNAL